MAVHWPRAVDIEVTGMFRGAGAVSLSMFGNDAVGNHFWRAFLNHPSAPRMLGSLLAIPIVVGGRQCHFLSRVGRGRGLGSSPISSQVSQWKICMLR